MLAGLVERVVDASAIDSVMVVRNGYVVLDTVIYPFPEDTGHIIHSVTKSVTATLIGIAIDQGLLAGVDIPVVEILADAAPEDVDELKASMTVEDLLTMSAGMDCGLAAHVEMLKSVDWTANVLAQPMVAEPGTQYEYCNEVSQLLSAILTEVTGTSAAEFAAEVLFEPLGITGVSWPASPNGISTGYGEAELLPADMAKIGYLYLWDGEWDGDQLVSPAWIEAATTTHIGPTKYSDGYGYQWRVMDDGYAFAKGLGGQYIFVAPDQDLVVAFTSSFWGDVKPRSIMTDYVFPAVVSDAPLPPNPDAQLRLAEAVAAAGSAPPPTAIELPEMAATVDGVRYEFRPNEFGNSWFAISFGDDSATLQLGVAGPPSLRLEPHLWFEDVGEPVEFEVGLDGRFIVDEAWGQPMASRGAWLDDDTFMIEYQIIGETVEGTYTFTFTDDVADLAFEDLATNRVQKSEADRVT
jgi:CubicO group peptidase (beta-lactamase class C family)